MNRYEIQQKFAEGAQARLYKAQDLITGKTCVLKAGESSHQEAYLSLQLLHPYIARANDIGIHPHIGRFAAYPEISHPSLLDWMRTAPRPENLVRVVLQIVEVIAFLHKRGFLYNDFKPEHFLIGEEEITVIDLGLCSRIRKNATSETFSGTFPYISPERMTGKPFDERSDIFALGMMLLRAFLPNENWNFQPSLSMLERLQRLRRKLEDFWGSIISEMTAFEPSQRIGSAAELWKRILPQSHKKNFLFFPVSTHVSLPENMLQKRVVSIRSASSLSLSDAKHQMFYKAWEAGFNVIHIDFRMVQLEACFAALHLILAGKASTQLISGVTNLQAIQTKAPVLLILESVDSLNDREKGLLSFSINILAQGTSFYFLVLTSEKHSTLTEETFENIHLASLKKQDVDRILSEMFPEERLAERAKPVLNRTNSLPEQILRELKRQLPIRSAMLWPAAAVRATDGAILERVSSAERKLLLFIATTGGSFSIDTLKIFFKRNPQDTIKILNHLEKIGAISLTDKQATLLFPAGEVLRRYRTNQIRALSSTLLDRLQNRAETKVLYHLGRHAGNTRLAAAAALSIFRLNRGPDRTRTSYEWLWNAFQCEARIPFPILYRMAKSFLRTGESLRARQILSSIYKKYGHSFKLAEYYIDYYHRCDQLDRAIRIAHKAAAKATESGNRSVSDYFEIRRAGFFILQLKLDEGETILRKLHLPDLTKKSLGLYHHFSALVCFYRGKLGECIQENEKAIQLPHPFRPTSIMNLGVAFAQMGYSEEAAKYLKRSIRIFTVHQDANRLAISYNNLGNVLKETAHLKEARDCYHRSLYLSRLSKHLLNYLFALDNLAITYELEGRTRRAIALHKKCIRISSSAKAHNRTATALTNLGLQYAYQSRFQMALASIRKAATIKKSLGHMVSLAATYEYLGLSHFLAGHPAKGHHFLKKAGRFFYQGECLPEAYRTRVYRALIYLEKNKFAEAQKMIRRPKSLELNPLTAGLRHLAKAMYLLRTERIQSSACRNNLHEAERIFRKMPYLFWLARSLKLKGEYFFQTDHPEKAIQSLQSALEIFSKLGSRKELKDFPKWGTKMNIPENFLNQMAEKLPFKVLLMIKKILAMEEPGTMISAILTAAMEFADMERAVLILNEDPPRIFKSASMDDATVQEIREISTTALLSASESDQPFLCFDVTTNPTFKDKASILSQHILSIVCLPLKTNRKNLGLLYLDSHEGVETVANTEMVLLQIFASIISLILDNAMELERSLPGRNYPKYSTDLSKEFPEIIGNSKETTQLLRSTHKLLENNLPILITGETGTGKELVARVLHYCGNRKNGPFVAVNSSAFSKELLESELFGHEQGAFTGAVRTKKGLFEEAQNGTIFLDEIGEMPISMQAKLLRILQDGEFRRVGGTVILRTNARVVLATHRDLEQMMNQGKFRTDLYYRISGVQLNVPPLRERAQDIPILAAAFLRKATQTTRKRILGFTPEAMEILKNYTWPGNVRQLKMEIEKIVAFSEEEWITLESLNPQIRESQKLVEKVMDNATSLQQIEKDAILERLLEFDWNVIQTARSLGLSRYGLYSKMKRLQIPRSRPEQPIQ